ncbi:hypothetical protein F5X98DRAFT_387997 [Xylaria grammica]|nr:hypothetical protein F5X98DRAFT_387997 [Xylaria grammica]
MPGVRSKVTGNVDGGSSLFITGPRSKKSKLSRLEEYDEDPGRAGSQKYRKLADMLEACTTKEESKSRTFLKQFRQDVNHRSMELRTFWQEKDQEFSRGQAALSTQVNQLSRLSARRDGQPGALRKEDHPLFQKSDAHTEDINSLLKQLEPVEAQGNRVLELPTARWMQDKHEMKEVLVCGGKYGQVLLGGALAPELAANAEIDQPNAGEHGKFAKELFRDGRKFLDDETWGHVAEDQLMQMSAIVNMLPLDAQVSQQAE